MYCDESYLSAPSKPLRRHWNGAAWIAVVTSTHGNKMGQCNIAPPPNANVCQPRDERAMERKENERTENVEMTAVVEAEK
jgi:hypothetical protein